jgi:hypothetical protein
MDFYSLFFFFKKKKEQNKTKQNKRAQLQIKKHLLFSLYSGPAKLLSPLRFRPLLISIPIQHKIYAFFFFVNCGGFLSFFFISLFPFLFYLLL